MKACIIGGVAAILPSRITGLIKYHRLFVGGSTGGNFYCRL